MQAIFVDAEGGEPAWVIAKLGRFGKAVAIPVHDCAAVAGRVWVPHEREVVRGAPSVDPEQPFAREHELAICAHYGIHEGHGRAAEVASREPGSRHREAGAVRVAPAQQPSCRAITICCTSSVPSPIVRILASR